MKFIIEGEKELAGKVAVSGAKNAALKMIAASLLFDGPVTLNNCPHIADVEKMAEIAAEIGCKVRWSGNSLTVNPSNLSTHILPAKLSQSLRGSVVFAGPLLAKLGKAVLPWPGGCNIGQRPLTTHTDILEKMGVLVEQKEKRYFFTKKGNPPKKVKLLERSVTATENAILYAALGKHTVTVVNAAGEPEIDDLISMLNSAGAQITRLNPKAITVVGVEKLKSISHTIIGDRIEAGTLMVAGLLLGKNLEISGFDPQHLTAPIKLAQRIGGDISVKSSSIIVNKSSLSSTAFKTAVYPGFPTDLQSPFGLLLTQARGKSILIESLFADRLKYLEELNSMGANTKLMSEHKAMIWGPSELKGQKIESTDLRAGATMVLAGLIAKGQTTVEKAEIIDRGYEKIDNKLSALGATIKRIE